jgi:hypothetical protein
MIPIRPSVFMPVAVVAFALASYSCTGKPLVSEPVEVIEEHDISGLNKPLEENVPTVDIVMFHSDNTEVTWEELQEEFTTADNIYRSYGVQLNLTRAFEVSFPPSWQGMASGEGTNVPTDDMELDFYEMMDFEQEVLPERLETILSSFIPDLEDSEHTIFIIPLSDLTVSWYERDENNAWAKVKSPTSAISFPPYLFADRIPKRLRGVISFQRSHANRRVLAHELGHKLINVSHEGLAVCPQGSGTDVPGLMGYGESVEIFDGEEGRWHFERLLRSPFLYRMVDGEKVWNQEYENGGSYDDPIYERHIMSPACP